MRVIMDLLHQPDCASLPNLTSLHSPPSAATPLSPPSHRQAKRARVSPISDPIRLGGSNGDQGSGHAINGHCSNLRESSNAEVLPGMGTAVTSQTPYDSNDCRSFSTDHLLENKFIQSSEVEVAVALNSAPSAEMPGDLASPVPKYYSHKDLNEARGGSEGQKRVSSSDPTLYIWDLDETLIIFQTLRNGRYAELFQGSKDPKEACDLGRRWESLILDICDDYFFISRLDYLQKSPLVEDFNEPSLLSLQDFDDGADLSHYNFDSDNLTVPLDISNRKKLVYRHRVIGELYEKGLENLLTQAQLTEWKNLYEATDVFTDGWLTAGRELLEACQRTNQQNKIRPNSLESSAGSVNIVDCDPILQGETFASNYNILVTSGTLVPSLVKCLLFRLDKYFHHLYIYSSREVGKLQCFHWIRERVQSLPVPVRFCVIGDGVDECEAAHDLAWPFVKITIGPHSVHRLPTVTMDIIDHYMKIVYDPRDVTSAVT